MTALTAANQLTLLRMLLIPVLALLVLYDRMGWALIVLILAALTDAFDGLLARRAGQQTTLGAWLDPVADKLLIATMFVLLTLPLPHLVQRVPLWLTVLVMSRDIGIVVDRRDRQPGGRPPHVPAVDLRQGRDRHVHDDGGADAVGQLHQPADAAGRPLRLGSRWR